jgi:hypothetical protein
MLYHNLHPLGTDFFKLEGCGRILDEPIITDMVQEAS